MTVQRVSRSASIVASGQTVSLAPWASASLLCFPWAWSDSWNQSSSGGGELLPGHTRGVHWIGRHGRDHPRWYDRICLLYTSDAADDLLCVDLGGRRIIKKKK